MLDTRRHLELFDPDYFEDQIHIIGAGATGSWLALQLAKLGVPGEQINVYDFDEVEPHNLPNQAYETKHVGAQKVDALFNVVQGASGAKIKAKDTKFSHGRLSGYVFLMVDSMEERKKIWEASIKMKSAIKLLVEPRMGLDVGRVYNVNPVDMNQIKKYEETYYSDDDAEVSACGTSQTVVTTAMGVASWCTRQMLNHLKGEEELDNEILIDFKYNNMFTTKW